MLIPIFVHGSGAWFVRAMSTETADPMKAVMEMLSDVVMKVQ